MTLINTVLENIDLTFDPEAIKAGLYKLRELFNHADELRMNLHKTESSEYGDLSEQITGMIHIMDEQDWDAKSVLEIAADIKCSADGSYLEWDQDVEMPANWETAVRGKLAELDLG